jgi:hypothetical protein
VGIDLLAVGLKEEMMKPNDLMELLFVAASAQTDEQKARVAWRASDHMWTDPFRYGLLFCRAFDNECQDRNFPLVKDLWSAAEIEARIALYGGPG